MAELVSYSILNLKEDAIALGDVFLQPGEVLANVPLGEDQLDYYIRAGLSVLNIKENSVFIGATGPAPWSLPTQWRTGGVYTSTLPASSVVYLSDTYVCTQSHTAGATFDASKFILVAPKGTQGIQGLQGLQGIQGIQGIQGFTPWAPLVVWTANTDYTANAPASLVAINGNSYVCTISHNSGSTFTASLSAGRWRLVSGKGDTGDRGEIGVTPWQNPIPWTPNTSWRLAAPTSVVTFNGSTYIAKVAHTSTNVFQAANWTLVASRGNTVLNGTTVPSSALGVDGDYYILNPGDGTGRTMYGPKSADSWPTSSVWKIEVATFTDVPGLVNALNGKANNGDSYTKAQTYSKDDLFTKTETTSAISSAVSGKANTGDSYVKNETYSKTETNTAINSAVSGRAVAGASYLKDETYPKTELNTKTETSNLISNAVSGKANTADVYAKTDTYTKTEIDGKFTAVNSTVSGKANTADVYAKTQTYSRTETYAKSETYSKVENDGQQTALATEINKKANSNDVYAKTQTFTKDETNTAINSAIQINSAVLNARSFFFFNQ